MEQITFENITLGGFWGEKQKLNRETTIYNVYNRFKDTGRFDAFKCNWKEGDPKKPHIFWDSDVYKWIEAVAYIITKSPDEKLEAIVDETVAEIKKNRLEDGYYNSYYIVTDPKLRFTNRDCHELYCLGHMIEAAVAYFNSTKKRDLLEIAEDYADLVEKIFKNEDSAAFSTPGHEEIELALIKLYECTGNKKHLALARHFINMRGTSKKDASKEGWLKEAAYSQSHLPVREMREAVGHCVRAVYLYSALADLAKADGDEKLKEACEALFDDIAYKKMYITGGLGAARIGEAFSEAFDLPNSLAYSETCAAIGLALFCRRMSLLEANGKYDDVAETAIYNTVLSGCSLDGKSFFYENPLEINLKEREHILKSRCSSVRFPLTQRVEVFDCSCCPPNFTRFVASIGDFLYSKDESTVYIHHYADSESEFDGIKLIQRTDYPKDGKVNITLENLKGKSVALRIPSWSEKTDIKVNNNALVAASENGFVYVDIISDKTEIEIDFNMKARLIEGNPLIQNNFGRVALRRGPVVYCLEALDNPTPLRALAVSTALNEEIIPDEYFGLPIITTDGVMYKEFDGLYRTLEAEKTPLRLKFIPYAAFANRKESDMLVWIRTNN